MNKAKVSEIFLSYQGEGAYIGSRQLFIRFFGCNLSCAYCDTRLTSYKTFTKEALLSKVLDFDDDYNELVFTGGEPLLFADFLADFIMLYRNVRNHRIYLETNGILFERLDRVIDKIDVVSMDFKLPSSSPGQGDKWQEHKKFLDKLSSLEVIVKAVITSTTDINDIKIFSRILKGVKGKYSVILQPVTALKGKAEIPDEEMLDIFRAYVNKETNSNVSILGQFHSVLGIK